MRYIFVFLMISLVSVCSCRPKATPGDDPAAYPESPDSLSMADTLSFRTPIDTMQKTATFVKLGPYDWVDLLDLDPTVIIDMRYATDSNFLHEKIYNCGRCFLRKAVADAALEVHTALRKKGMGLKFFDCYRPRPFQQKLWDKMPDPRYVTNPKKGSMHNRGAAVDLTIVDSTGKELDMGTGFDFFGPKAYHTFTDHPDTVLANRQLLKTSMEGAGFKSIRTEWWHYSYTKVKGFELSDYLWDCETYESKN